MSLDFATVLLSWSAGGWFCLWVTTRRREVGLGYGWLLRGVFLAVLALAVAVGVSSGTVWAREIASVMFGCAGVAALVVSVMRKNVQVSGQRERAQRRKARVQTMLNMNANSITKRSSDTSSSSSVFSASAVSAVDPDAETALSPADGEFPPALDLVAASLGIAAAMIGAVAGGVAGVVPGVGGVVGSVTGTSNIVLDVARIVVGALFLGAIINSMLLGHWYLVQPGLSRAPLIQMVEIAGCMWLIETIVMLLPVGMLSVINGNINDGYNGLLGFFWIACVLSTVVLVAVTRIVLNERGYSAIMAATGLIYLAIITAFGQDLVARVLLDIH